MLHPVEHFAFQRVTRMDIQGWGSPMPQPGNFAMIDRTVASYREHADKCRRMAGETNSEIARAVYLDLARQWDGLARDLPDIEDRIPAAGQAQGAHEPTG